jgi:hypothetical protein
MKYPGKLGKPRPYQPVPGLLADDQARKAWATAEVREQMEVARALFDYYGHDYGDWMRLAWAMIEDHVPAIRRAAKSGRRSKWGMIERAELAILIDNMIDKNPSLKPSDAAATLCRKEPWRSLLSAEKNPADALRKQYGKADRRWVNITRELALYRELNLPADATLADLAHGLGKNIRES